MSSSSSSSSIRHGVGPLVDPFRSHVSRSLFKGLPVGEKCFITLGNLLRGILFTCCIRVICPKLVLFLIPKQFAYLFCNLSECILLFISCISSLLLLFFWRQSKFRYHTLFTVPALRCSYIPTFHRHLPSPSSSDTRCDPSYTCSSAVEHHVPGQLSVEAIFSPCAANYRHTINIKLLHCVRGEDIWLPDDGTSFSRD